MSDPIVNTMQPGLRNGDKLKHFEVQDQLGAGGMGIVWRGYDRLLDRHVAIKQIASPDGIDEIARQKFRAEAELQKKISSSSPNIVQVIDLVDDPRGLFIIMEFVDGPSVDRLLNQTTGPVEPLRALMILRDAAQGLAAVHAAGAIHRDLKPGNILLTPAGQAKICDFDLATLLADQESQSMGTAQYMAPEMFSGSPVDARADLYALGMIAYEILAGRPAFREAFKAIVKDTRNQAMKWMKWHTNLRVNAPPLKELNPAVPDVLAELVGRLLAKDPANRIESAAQLLEAIKRHFVKASPQQIAAARQQAKSATGTAKAIAGMGRGNTPLSPLPLGAGPGPAMAGTLATAPLPKKSKLVWILAATTVILASAVGFIFWKQGHDKQLLVDARINEAKLEYKAAFDKYFATPTPDYAGAKAGFDALAPKWEKDPLLGVGSTAYSHLATARMTMTTAEGLMKEAKYDESAKAYGEVRKELDVVEALNIPGNPEKLTGEFEYMDREVKNRKPFVEVVGEIQKLIASADYDPARLRLQRLIDSSRGAAGTVRTAAEKEVIGGLANSIANQEQAHSIEQADAAAAALVADGKLPEAKKSLEKSLQKFGTAPVLKDRLRSVEKTISLNAALADAKTAEAAGKLDAAVAALQRANEIESAKEREDKIKQLRSTMAYNEGVELEKTDATAAAAKYQAATQFWPHPEADARLAAMKLSGDRASMLSAADNALASGDYQQAINLWESAQKINAAPEIAEKIQKATVRIDVKAAEALLKKADLNGARTELEKALAIDPADAPAKTMLGKLEQIAQYNVFVQEADKLRAAHKYGPAKETYQKAINLAKDAKFDSKEIQDRKFDTEYEHLIAEARSAISSELWEQASGLLTAAKKMRASDVVDGLLAEVEPHVKKKPAE